jgi:hypothetical protein
MKLRRLCPGVYASEDDTIQVTRYVSHTWSPTKGQYKRTTWTAIIKRLMVDKTTPPESYEVAKAQTLDKLQEYLNRYEADAVAGTLGPRSRYGFYGDSNPVAKP